MRFPVLKPGEHILITPGPIESIEHSEYIDKLKSIRQLATELARDSCKHTLVLTWNGHLGPIYRWNVPDEFEECKTSATEIKQQLLSDIEKYVDEHVSPVIIIDACICTPYIENEILALKNVTVIACVSNYEYLQCQRKWNHTISLCRDDFIIYHRHLTETDLVLQIKGYESYIKKIHKEGKYLVLNLRNTTFSLFKNNKNNMFCSYTPQDHIERTIKRTSVIKDELVAAVAAVYYCPKA